MEQESEFITQVIFNALDIEPMNVYKKIGYCFILGKVLSVPFKLPKDLNHYDVKFSRAYYHTQAMMTGDKNIDYLGADFGKDDIFKFDDKMWAKIMRINKIADAFISECAKRLSDEFNQDFTRG